MGVFYPIVSIEVLNWIWFYRWGATPLQDAVSAGHQQTASIIIAAGGVISSTYGKAHVFQAAAKGDVKALSTLYDYAGLKVDLFTCDAIIFLGI
jgi:hypothetical protein